MGYLGKKPEKEWACCFNNTNITPNTFSFNLLMVFVWQFTTNILAFSFLWKEIGTSFIHLSQTHYFIKVMRKIIFISPDTSKHSLQ